MNAISVSGIKTYIECPFRFRVKYIDGIDLESTSPALTFGKALHKGIEFMDTGREFKDGFEEEIQHLIVRDKEGKPKSEAETEKEKERCRRMGTAMLIDMIGQIPEWDVAKVEWKDMAPIRHPLREKVVLQYPLKFIMDRTTTDHRIIDWKSAVEEWDESELVDNLQGDLYAMAYKSKFGRLPEEVIFVVMKKRIQATSTQILSYVPNEFDLAMTFKKVQTYLKMIKLGYFDDHCGYCDYCKRYGKSTKQGAKPWQRRKP